MGTRSKVISFEESLTPTPLADIPDTTLAWLAALIDAEGSLSLNRKRASYDRKSYRARARISNTSYLLMEALVAKTGINRISERHRQPGLGHKDYWVWTMEAGELRRWLPALLPKKPFRRRWVRALVRLPGKRSRSYEGLPGSRCFFCMVKPSS